MEVRLLGPVVVVDDDRVLAIRQRRQRSLLALLALRAGETVGIDRLVEDLWGADAPKTAVASLQNAVSQLRKLLGAGTLVTREPGYALDTGLVALDVDRFELLLSEARAARAMQDERTVAAVLREALGLWRGPALSDLAYEPFAQAEIRRLEELRQGALEDRIDADLALGRQDELVPELETLVAQEPLRERLHGQLMLALYRAERQADALAAYRAARGILVEELGIEPGPELKELHAAVLRQDAALLLPRAQAAAPQAPMQFRRLATILVADVVASSAGEEVDPETLHHILGRYDETVTGVVSGHGGTVERMAGDSVMAAFGATVADESHALRAVRAAADLRAAVARINDETDDGPRVDLRIGIATGEVLVAGGSGSRQRRATGEAIGVAAGLEQAAGPGEIVIGPLTQRLVRTAATTEPLGELALPHRPRPVAAFRLLDVSTEQPTFGSLLDTPLVGRKRELRALRAVLREARAAASPRAVCVLGPAGIGKSRLVREVVRGARGFDVRVARCPSYGQGITYWPLAQLLGEDADAVREVVEDERAAEILVRLDGTPAEIAWAFRRWCEASARRTPLLLAVDDLHWAEPTFLELLEQLVALGDGPIALIGLARDELLEEHPSFLGPLPDARRLAVDGLAVGDTESLVEELLGGAPLSAEVRSRVFDVAEGNPLFVEQLVALAAEGDGLGIDPQLPATIQALLAARLDRLGPGERAVLERAAVVGRDFTTEHVTALLDPVAVPTAGRHLESLARRGFVEVRRSGGLRFRHVLMQDAAYRAAPKKLRAELHERLADRLDGEVESRDELAGYHLERAFRLRTELGPPDRAARRLAEDAGRLLGAAGIRAWQRHDAPAAIGLLRRAASLLPEADEWRLELLCELGTALKFVSEDDLAEETLLEVAETARASGSRRLALRAELERSWRRYLRGQIVSDEIVALAEHAIPVFEAAEDERALGRAWLLLAAARSLTGRWGLCTDAAARALGHQERAGFTGGATVTMLAAAAYAGPEPVESAIDYCTELMRRQPLAESASFVLVILAHLEAMRGRFEDARRALTLSREFVEERGGVPSSDWVGAVAAVEMLADRPAAAEAPLRDECARLEERGDRAWRATLEAALAEVLYAQGRADDALPHAVRAEELAQPDDLTAQTAWRRVAARLSAHGGDAARGESLAREAVAMLDDTDALNDAGLAALDLAEVLYRSSRFEEARAVCRPGFDRLASKGNVAGLERARRRLSELDPATRDGGALAGSPT